MVLAIVAHLSAPRHLGRGRGIRSSGAASATDKVWGYLRLRETLSQKQQKKKHGCGAKIPQTENVTSDVGTRTNAGLATES